MNRRLLSVLVFAVSVIGLGMGVTLPLVSLRLHEAGASSLVIGTLSAMPAAGMILAALLVNPLCQYFSGRILYLACFALCALSASALEWLPDALAPLALARLALGLGMGVAVILGESWVNELCGERRRGQVVALYAACFTGFQLVGPALIALLGTQGSWPVVIVTLANLAALALLWHSLPERWVSSGEDTARSFSLAGFIRVAPALCTGVLFFAFFDAVVLSLFPLYASAHGYALGVAALMASVILAGDMAFQVPLGWLADRLDRRALHLFCGVLTLGLGLALPCLMEQRTLLWPALLVLGAAAGGIYTLALVLIGQDFRGPDLVTANACIGLLWGIGSLLGPVLSGALMSDRPQGLPLALSLAAAIFVTTAMAARRRKRHTVQARG
ncbi:MFS transporter [Phytopseudomonas dryadis]|uniref:MFS transporter n=1 Tax=Phytopseudomonas dryadis TaxID=2487520 RepID=A0ABY1ZAQ2_9GAMM|nr:MULTISPECIES: MFS transporter [Pseudomonas]TBV08936.1 MFS transporter [Pseudomonas dryadis]TBV15121.1 MFS transporter [Pseudomonas sp. FRB 230]